jgi:aldehyde:ferredoxin oxidoreductase
MKGFYNQILWVDVAERTSRVERLADALLEACLGGKGLASHLLLKHNPPGVEPLDPENHLIFALGPLSGSPVWGSCRHGVFTKSPQTGGYSESYSGGTAAEYMARAGFDAVILRGASREPVWIEISGGGALFHEARDLWGRDTFETEDAVKGWMKEHRPDARKCGVLCIGPAGERLVSYAVIENDHWRSAGRTGAGAVMGSKRVKAVAFWGDCTKELAEPGLVKDYVKEFAKRNKDTQGVNAYRNLGTPMMVDIMSQVGSFPTRYWYKGQSPHREAINAAALHRKMEVTPHACLRCFIACGRLGTVKEGRHRGLTIEGPEYETIYAFGGLCEISSIEEIAYLNDLCDRLGMDTISAGNLAAFAMEASRRGKLKDPIDYGETDRLAELLGQMARREGAGDLLAHGIKYAAKEWGMEDVAIHVKGLEPAGYDPRVLKGMGLAYGSSPRGACHLRSTFYKPELTKMIDPDQIAGKGEMFAEWEDRLILFDSLILCRFYRDLYPWEELGRMLKGVIGMDLDIVRMRKIAARVIDTTRLFNGREGLTEKDDKLPARFHREALPETDKIITEEEMDQLLQDYYRARGWDPSGRPRGGGVTQLDDLD